MYMNMRMLVCIHKSHLQTLVFNHQDLNHCLITSIIRTYRTKRIIPTNVDSPEFRISFLKDKCGLSGKPLVRACKCLHFDSSDQKPHLVLEFLRTFGFPPSSITKIIAHYPDILQCNPDKAVQPKLDFFVSISISQSEVVDFVTKSPHILRRSLNNHLIPFFDQLKCITGCYQSAVAFLKCNPYLLSKHNSKVSLSNIKYLVKLGVPHSQILKLLTMYGQATSTPADRFRSVVSKLKDMNFDLESSYFLNALRTLTFINDSTWESRRVLFKSFGFSDQEILSLFKKQPLVMAFTEKNINEKMDFFLNKLQWTTSRLSSNPSVIAYSLEKRTIPRCSVLQFLVSKNRTSQSYMLSSILVISERRFIENFVTTHKDEVPEIMEAYQGKLRFDEYTFKQKGQLKLKPT